VRDLRFGFTLATHGSQRELTQTCRTAEAYGYDIAVGVDHLGPGRASPFQSALAAAFVTDRMRVGTYVLNCGFWNPWVVAREVSTTVRLSGGRFELGLGTGVIKAQFEAAKIPWLPYQQRVDKLAATIGELDDLLAAEHDLPRPPLLVGGTTERTLRLAAEHADIVSFGGRVQASGAPAGTLRIVTAAETGQRVEFFRAVAGARADEVEWNAFVIDVEVTDDRRAAAERVAADYAPHTAAEEVLESPFVLLGTEDEIARQLVENRERYGFTSTYVQRPHMTELGPSIQRARRLVRSGRG
jgi:probable F420-dependent oxidoreductase